MLGTFLSLSKSFLSFRVVFCERAPQIKWKTHFAALFWHWKPLESKPKSVCATLSHSLYFFRLNCSNMIFLFHSSDSHKSREQVCKQRSTKHKAGFVRRKKFTRNLIAMRLPKPTMVVVGVWAAEKKTTLQVKRYALEERSSKAENNFKIDLVLIAFASAFYHCCPIQSRKNQKFSFLRIS